MSQRPNLLYIHSDQHNPRVTGCYGDPLVQTPNLDGLAKRGVMFENAYCPSPICVPSRMSTLTGLHPYENQVWTNSHVLSSSIPTLAHAMGAGGYRPALIGRMHALGPDQLHGYAERIVGDHSPNHIGGRGVDHGYLTGTNGPARVSLEKSGHGQNAYQVHDEDVTEAAVAFLQNAGSEPFSLSVGFMLPHQPFVARMADYEHYFRSIHPPRISEPFADTLHPHIKMWREACGIKDVTDIETRRARAAYWTLVDRMDRLIGEILCALRGSGLEENTIVVYSSDHGEQVGEHGLWWKQTFYEDSVKVPAIISWPGQLPEGLKIDRVISSLDLNATMLDALGCPPLPNSRGRSLMPLMDKPEDTEWQDFAYSEFCMDAAGSGGPFPEEGVVQRMVRRGDWKLNYYHGQPSQLFNLAEDPYEETDRIGDPECAELIDELTALLLEEWDPGWVSHRLSELRADQQVLSSWAKKTDPSEAYRWDLRPEMDYLDTEQME